MEKWFKILFDDYSAPAITSFAKEYYGTLNDIKTFIDVLEKDEEYRTVYRDTIQSFSNYLCGDKNAKHSIAYQKVPLLTPVKIIYNEKQILKNKEWEHINAWNCPYNMRLKSADVQHYWIKDGKRYRRIIKAQIDSLCYKGFDDDWIKLSRDFWGFPGILSCNDNVIHNNLACIEKNFDSLDDLQKDHENFLSNPDVNFAEICNDIFGDG